jgi:hypothetical protein
MQENFFCCRPCVNYFAQMTKLYSGQKTRSTKENARFKFKSGTTACKEARGDVCFLLRQELLPPPTHLFPSSAAGPAPAAFDSQHLLSLYTHSLMFFSQEGPGSSPVG